MSLSVEDIKDYKTLDISNIVFSDPKKTRGSYISLGYHNDSSLQPLVIQTPKLKICGGVNKSDTRAFIDLEFDKSHWAFYEFMTSIDEHNIIYIQKHSKKWFNKSFPLDVVDDFYTTPVKTARKKNPPKLKLKLPISKGMIDTNIYDLGNNLIDYRDVISDSKIVATIKLLGLRFLKQQVICEWVPLQLKIYQEPNINNKVNGYLINNNLLSDDEEENITDLNLEVQEETENIESNNESSDNQVDTSESDSQESKNQVDTSEPDFKNQEPDNQVDTSEPDSENQEPLIHESNNQESLIQESDKQVNESEPESENQEPLINESMNQESDNQVNESEPESENLETETQNSDNQVDKYEPEKMLQESINSDSQDESTSDITDSSNQEQLIENDESDDNKEYESENIIIDIDEPDLEELMFESNNEIPEAYQKIIDNTKKELEEQKRINMEQSSKIEELKNKISEIFSQFKNPL